MSVEFFQAALWPVAVTLAIVALAPRSWWGPPRGYQASRFPRFCGYPSWDCDVCGRVVPALMVNRLEVRGPLAGLGNFCRICYFVWAARSNAHRYAWELFNFANTGFAARCARGAARVGLGRLAYRLARVCFHLWYTFRGGGLYYLVLVCLQQAALTQWVRRYG